MSVHRIVIECVSPAMRRYHCSEPFVSCEMHAMTEDEEIRRLNERLGAPDVSTDETMDIAKQINELEEGACPLYDRLQSLDPSDAQNEILIADHVEKGCIEIVVNLALSVDWERLDAMVIQIIADEQGWDDYELIAQSFTQVEASSGDSAE